MSNKEIRKYEFVEGDTILYGDIILRRIRGIRDFGIVKKGDLGGNIESVNNLSHEGNCWVGDNACVFEDTQVYGDAMVYENACVWGNSKVYGESKICGHAYFYDLTF